MAPKTRERDGKVWCPKCQELKVPDNFRRNNPERVKRTGSIFRAHCIECERESSRKRHYKRRYGITEEQKFQLINIQGNKCSCCGNEFDDTPRGRPVVDHCHKSGNVRDILCDRYNTALGWVQEDIELCENLIEYIKKHQ